MRTMGNLKISVSGPNASGKTTIAHLLAKELKLQLINEDVEKIFSLQNEYLKASRSRPVNKEILLSAKKKWVQSFFEWSKLRHFKYTQSSGFVADRWEADLLDFWLVNFGKEAHLDNLTSKLFNNFQAKAKNLDLAIIMPFKQPYSKNPNESNLPRVSSFSNRLLNSVVTTGIIYTATNLKILKVPYQLSNIEETLDYIIRAIKKK